jgi:hypothetical protein
MGQAPDGLEARIQALEDLEAIKRLKHSYFRCLDMRLWDELRGYFVHDATVDYGGQYKFAGADTILKFLSESLGEQSGSHGLHMGGHPSIELTSATTARGTWVLWNVLFNPGQQRNVRIGAYYDDEYVKTDGAWKIKHTSYTYLFREEWSRADTPSLRLLYP